MNKTFYKQFEDKFRGSRQVILSRLEFYIPLVSPLAKAFPTLELVDLGCGRGEWLELLRGHGILANGVDIDEEMIAECRELGLSVTEDDALSKLKSLEDASVPALTGFHVAEHVSFEGLMKIVFEARRVLVPGGLLILETPNPENLTVGACNFYLDPTHNKPIPPPLLAFVAEFAGFASVNVARLNSDFPTLKQRPSAVNLIAGVGQDYSVIARKQGGDKHTIRIEEHLSDNNLTSISDIIEAYLVCESDEQAKIGRIHALEENLDLTKSQIEPQLDLINDLQADFQQLNAAFRQSTEDGQRISARVIGLEEQLGSLLAQIDSISSSLVEINNSVASFAEVQVNVAKRQAETDLASKNAILEREVQKLAGELAQSHMLVDHTNAKVKFLEDYIDQIHASGSWGITRPMRSLVDASRVLRRMLGK